jgi:predicted nucleotidyltransferase
MICMEILNSHQKRIIELLLQGNKTLSEIVAEIGISKPGAIKHLKKLEEFNIIKGEYERNYDGRIVRYHLQPFHMLISIDPETNTALSFAADDVLDEDFILLGNIPQKEFRDEVKEYLKQITNVNFVSFLIILYGSVAQGSANRKSDIDLLILKDSWTKNETGEILDRIVKATIGVNHATKPLFLSFDDFKTMDETLKKEIKDNGIIIYEKGKQWNEIKQELRRYKSIMI